MPAGRYRVQCKPGMAGEGISATLTVTAGGTGPGAAGGATGSATVSADPRLVGAVDRYRSYVAAQVEGYLVPTGSGVWACPPGVQGPDDYWGRGLLEG